jgi:hypothetical protein
MEKEADMTLLPRQAKAKVRERERHV